MVSIVNHFSEVSSDSDDYEEPNDMQMGKIPENSISIDSSDDYDDDVDNNDNNTERSQSNLSVYPSLHMNGNVYRTEEDFQAEINRLKKQSTNRFKSKWEEILEKYAQIDDEKESDEIDLASGEIITDNGHLRSLRTGIRANTDVKFDGDIWSVTYDLERDIHNRYVKEARHKQQKMELKRQLKDQKLFHNVSLQSSPLKADDFTRGSSFASSSEDNLLSLNPSPTKKFKVSPVKGIRGSSPVRDDDISLLTPTKRKSRKLSNIYNAKSLPTKLHFDDIPRLHMDDYNIAKSGDESYDDMTNSPFFVYNSSLRDNSRSYETNSPQDYDDDTPNTATASDGKGYAETSETSDVESDDNKATKLSSSDQYLVGSNTNQYVSESEDDNDDYSLDFDDEFSIVTDPCIYPPTESSTNIYSCAIEHCHYCTGNKSLYQSHLLDKHSTVLHSLGYPIREDTSAIISNPNISQSTVKKLTKYFPLIFEVPRLPLSKNSQPFICGLNLGNSRTCQKFFVTKHDLILHHQNAPNECSYKKQVLICPMLGCGYMTDMGYLEWRSHFIEKKHHLDPKHKRNRQNEEGLKHEETRENEESNLSQLSYIPNLYEEEEEYEKLSHLDKINMPSSNISNSDQPTKVSTILDVVNEINDIFSDSGSDASINEYLNDDGDIEFSKMSVDVKRDPQRPYHNEMPNLKIQLNLHEDLPYPLDEDLQTGHESIEELFDD
ncbi:DEHA2D15642p [Debaryomyces hansenii CBS767]|uniref:DEHA2D15642p n=1 Tax=Debaryomyces hansenii (strain ATCC 36239 / CBS 767 / BCRC 21394 / JCM 1990 / NBRC 0083 / IGC 2968) TaxID=284592 RepID=B5RTJ1_DEBHA|nr:DEHA2D15642p [Debaryomyces hansenii CBS767]CAR65676.1 DEHA2D15642p [Debaryomyces hansenii CBS767]|eukprot:XP_002770322.1 DEHA2D15642p [Debaryomyces hansenii CBS767]